MGAWVRRPLRCTPVAAWLLARPEAPRELLDCAGWAVDPRALVPCLSAAQPSEPSAPGGHANGTRTAAAAEEVTRTVEARTVQLDAAEAALARKAEAQERLKRDMKMAQAQMATVDAEVTLRLANEHCVALSLARWRRAVSLPDNGPLATSVPLASAPFLMLRLGLGLRPVRSTVRF